MCQMYHVKGKRKKDSAKLVCDALISLSETIDFDEITITEISNHSTISRNTIYRLFDSKEDILNYILDERMLEIVQQYDNHVAYNVLDHSYDMIYKSYLTYFKIWDREKNILKIMSRCNKLHHLYPLIKNSLVNNNSEYIISKINTGDNFREYYYAWLSGAITSILIQWINTECQETPEELTNIIMTLFKSTSYKFWNE